MCPGMKLDRPQYQAYLLQGFWLHRALGTRQLKRGGKVHVLSPGPTMSPLRLPGALPLLLGTTSDAAGSTPTSWGPCSPALCPLVTSGLGSNTGLTDLWATVTSRLVPYWPLPKVPNVSVPSLSCWDGLTNLLCLRGNHH